MSQHYSQPEREQDDPYALPDVEVFRVQEADTHDEQTVFYDCEPGWYYWYCFPGCLPDSEPFGPFESKADALADARLQSAWYGEDE